MITIKIAVMLACAALFWWGGYIWHNARRFILPLVLCAALFFFSHSLWAWTALLSIGIFCLGYGDKSPLRHIFGDGWGRGVWGLLAATAIATGLFVAGHIHLYFFVPYLGLNFMLENVLKKLPQSIGDPIIGLGLASVVCILC